MTQDVVKPLIAQSVRISFNIGLAASFYRENRFPWTVSEARGIHWHERPELHGWVVQLLVLCAPRLTPRWTWR